MGRYGLAALRALADEDAYGQWIPDATPSPAPSTPTYTAPTVQPAPSDADSSMVTSPIQASAMPGGSGVSNSNDPTQNSGVNLVDFGATWCGWCVKMKPVVAQVEGVFPGHVFSVDVDQQPDWRRSMGLMPTRHSWCSPTEVKFRASPGRPRKPISCP